MTTADVDDKIAEKAAAITQSEATLRQLNSERATLVVNAELDGKAASSKRVESIDAITAGEKQKLVHARAEMAALQTKRFDVEQTEIAAALAAEKANGPKLYQVLKDAHAKLKALAEQAIAAERDVVVAEADWNASMTRAHGLADRIKKTAAVAATTSA